MARSRKIHRLGAKAETKGGVWPKGQSSLMVSDGSAYRSVYVSDNHGTAIIMDPLEQNVAADRSRYSAIPAPRPVRHARYSNRSDYNLFRIQFALRRLDHDQLFR